MVCKNTTLLIDYGSHDDFDVFIAYSLLSFFLFIIISKYYIIIAP